ncbi:MAG: PbpA, partial [Desulfobacteraceae bacterium]|nr:PbpA [Desulfobacteraceae bacterium]
MLKKQTLADIEQKRKQNFKKYIKISIYACSITAVILIGLLCINFIYTALFPNTSIPVGPKKKPITFETDKQADQKKLSNIEIKEILGQHNLLNSDVKSFTINSKDETYKIITSLDIHLQKFLIKKLDRLKQLTRGKPQRIAIVVMEPASGKVLALTGFDLISPDKNPCFDGNFPAASIFKIITATAAIEELGFTPYTPLYFNGSKYTLYKNQLKNIKNKYTIKISFENAFAESVNPVFGKIGSNRLGSINLEKYANKFGFNKNIDSELIFEPSRLEISESPYQWAEIGCGFNNTTTISPIFGAMITSAIINDGKRTAPSIIDKIVDSQNDIIYYKNYELLSPAVG